jgi:O-antigen/teichoic acid export membrane protein
MHDVSEVIKIAVLYAVPATLAQFSNNAHQIVLEHLMELRALGLFVVFLSYTRLISPIGSTISSIMFHNGIIGEDRYITRIFRISLIIYLLCALPLYISAKWIIPFLYGKEFIVDNLIIGVLIICTVFAQLADSLSEYLNGHGRLLADIKGRILYLISVFILGIWLVSSYGLLGMAISMALGDILRCLYLIWQTNFETKKPIKEFWLITFEDAYALIISGKKILKH